MTSLILKAKGKPVQRPGSRGGRYWIDSRGQIRYDAPPKGAMLHAPPREVAAIAKMTPVAVDTKLAALYLKADAAEGNLRSAENRRRRMYLEGTQSPARELRERYLYHPASLAAMQEADAEIVELQEALAKIHDQAAPYERAYAHKRWSRFFLVQNDGGHVHSSMQCSTCFPTTRFAWLPNFSGSSEKAMVDEFGSMACTVCFPSAPTYKAFREGGRVQRATQAEVQAKRQEKAQKRQAAEDATVRDPIITDKVLFKTLIAAQRELGSNVGSIIQAERYAPNEAFEGSVAEQEERNERNAGEYRAKALRVALAIAVKTGEPKAENPLAAADLLVKQEYDKRVAKWKKDLDKDWAEALRMGWSTKERKAAAFAWYKKKGYL